MGRYTHEPDEIDGLMTALFRLHETEGLVAARAALPANVRGAVRRLMTIEGVGFARATEIVLRVALWMEGS